MPTQSKSFSLLLLAFCGLIILLSSRAVPDTSSVTRRPPSVGTTLSTYSEHLNAVSAIAWSPDGKYLASASFDKTVQVWEATTGKHLLTYRGHSDTVTAVAWSPDGSRLASASYDRQCRSGTASPGSLC
jgi:WD40 repeat protein